MNEGLGANRSRVVASFATYADARQAVDHLVDQKFPVGHLRIVADDLRFEEQVTGPRGWRHAATRGATSGAFVGALLGIAFGVLELTKPVVSDLALASWGALLGLGAGVLWGLFSHALTAGGRDLSSMARYTAGRYRLLADREWADRARRTLGQVAL